MSGPYKYKVEGTTGNGNTFTTEGTVDGGFPEVFTAAMRDSFQQLTRGRAQFGTPGVGCQGPYEFTRFVLEKITQ
jgi:hypothetical protein